MRRFLYNFGYALFSRLPHKCQLTNERVESFLVDGCERHTPVGHPWSEGPMF